MSAKWYDWVFNPLGTLLNKSSNDYTEEQNAKQFDLSQEQFNYQKDFDAQQLSFEKDAYYNNYQNTTADMSKAGLNPLMLGGSGTNSASVSGSNVQSNGFNPQQLQGSESPIGLMQGILGNITQRKNVQSMIDAQSENTNKALQSQNLQTLLSYFSKQRELDLLEKRGDSDVNLNNVRTSREQYELDFLRKFGLLGGSNSSSAIDLSSGVQNVEKAVNAIKDVPSGTVNNNSFFDNSVSLLSRDLSIPNDVAKSFASDIVHKKVSRKQVYENYKNYCKSSNKTPVNYAKFLYYTMALR